MESEGCPHKHEGIGPCYQPDAWDPDKPYLIGGRIRNQWQNVKPNHIAVFFADGSSTIIEKRRWEKICERDLLLTKDDFIFSSRPDRSCVRYFSPSTKESGSYAANALKTTDDLVSYIDGNGLHNCRANLRKIVTNLRCGGMHVASSIWDTEDETHVPYRTVFPNHVELKIEGIPNLVLARADWIILQKENAQYSVERISEQRYTIMCTLTNLITTRCIELAAFVCPILSGQRVLVIDGDDSHLCPENLCAVVKDFDTIVVPSPKSSSGFCYITAEPYKGIPTTWRFRIPGKDTKYARKSIPIPAGVPPKPAPLWVQKEYADFVHQFREKARKALEEYYFPGPVTDPDKKISVSRDPYARSQRPSELTGIIGITIQHSESCSTLDGIVATPDPIYWKVECVGKNFAATRYERIPKGRPPRPVPEELVELNNKLRKARRQGLPLDTYVEKKSDVKLRKINKRTLCMVTLDTCDFSLVHNNACTKGLCVAFCRYSVEPKNLELFF